MAGKKAAGERESMGGGSIFDHFCSLRVLKSPTDLLGLPIGPPSCTLEESVNLGPPLTWALDCSQ